MEAVIFDFFGVVARPRDIYTRIAGLLGKGVEDVGPHYQAYEKGRLSREAFWDRVGVEKHEDIEKKLVNSFSENPSFDRIFPALRHEYKIGVLSNSDSYLFRALLDKFELSDAFDYVVVSEEVGMAKPSREIYEKVLNGLGTEAEEAVFIDDRLINLKGAAAVGLTTVHHEVAPERGRYEPDYTIESLEELPGILEDLESGDSQT